MSKKPAVRVLNAIADSAWAILPESLDKILEIASREHEVDVDALASKMGQRVDKTYNLRMREGGVAVLNVEGPLFRYANLFTMFSGGSSFDMLAIDFGKAMAHEDVKSVILHINSPGGQTDGTSEFAQMVKEARGKKPITAYVSHIGASAAYWIASAADSIVVEKAGSVGSIGTVARVRTDKEKDVREIVSSQSPRKRPDVTSDEGRQQIQEYVDALSDIFIDTVAENRGVKRDKVLKDFGQGGMLVGEAAVAAGMADSVGTLEGVIASMSGKLKRKEVRGMDEIRNATREILAQHNPSLLNSLLTEGATAERKRIQDIEALALPGHEKVIAEMKFDGKTSASDAALRIVAAEKETRKTQLAQIHADAPAPQPATLPRKDATPAVTNAVITRDMSRDDVKAALKPEWDKDSDLRAEFQNDFVGYCIYREQEARGNISYLRQSK